MYDISSYAKGVTTTSASFTNIWIIVSVVVAIFGGIAIYFAFLSKSNDGKFKGFLGWLYDFLKFRKLLVEDLLKITYLILAIYITLSAFSVIGTSFLVFLFQLILGNLVLRVFYELMLLVIQICKNTTEINKKMKK